MAVRDPQWTADSIVESLISLPCLAELAVSYSVGSTTTLALNRFTSLHKIVVSGRLNSSREDIAQLLGETVANSPRLVYLDFDSLQCCDGERTPALCDLFGKLPTDPPLRLRHLRLNGCYMHLDNLILPHLRSLTSLTLGNYVLSDAYSRSTRKIWSTLQSEGIYVTTLETYSIDEALLQYLASYSGLEKLSLPHATGDTDELSDTLADEFYSVVLPKHANTLVNLVVRSGYEGRWCFGDNNIAAILTCKKLSGLLMSVRWRVCVDHELGQELYDENGSSSVVRPLIRAQDVSIMLNFSAGVLAERSGATALSSYLTNCAYQLTK